MAAYLANQIILGSLEYNFVVTRKPEMKEDIDNYLTEKGKIDLIVEL